MPDRRSLSNVRRALAAEDHAPAISILSIGELLWDVFADGERLGGAAFNFSAHAVRLGMQVEFISATGEDARGKAARQRAREVGLADRSIQVVSEAPTGTVSVRLEAGGQPSYSIHRPAAYDFVRHDAADLDRLAALDPQWLYFGTLHQSETNPRALTRALMDALPSAIRFYDVNLRDGCYTAGLVLELMAAADVVKLNAQEARIIDGAVGDSCISPREFTLRWAHANQWQAVAVTMGARGCAVRIGDDYAELSAHPVDVVDTVGAGDAFSAAFLYGLSQGWGAARVGQFANRAGAVVASRPGGAPLWTMRDCWSLDKVTR